MEVEDMKADIKTKSADEIYNEFFISGEVWIFKNIFGDHWFEQYDKFKKYIAEKLGVHYNNIGIAGSAKLGFSLNPENNFRNFNDKSDIDIIIVSQKLFYEFWEQYLKDSYNPTAQINKIYDVGFCIFRKYIRLDCFRNNEYYNNWQKKIDGFEKDIQLRFQIENDIHYRIFESWDSVKMYYMSGIAQLKKSMEGDPNDEQN